MTLNINQFAQTTVQGELDLLGFGSDVISGQVDSAQSTALVPGQAVKMATTAGGVPKFIALAANTDQTFGFVVFNLKDISYPALSKMEIALGRSVMWMTSGGAITRGAGVEVVYTTNTIITSGGTNPVVGIALDTAAASGALIRVLIKTPL